MVETIIYSLLSWKFLFQPIKLEQNTVFQQPSSKRYISVSSWIPAIDRVRGEMQSKRLFTLTTFPLWQTKKVQSKLFQMGTHSDPNKWRMPGWRIEQRYANNVLIGNWSEERHKVGRISTLLYVPDYVKRMQSHISWLICV